MTRLVALVGLVLSVVACGATDTASSPTASASAAATTPGAKPTPVRSTFKLGGLGTGILATGTIAVTSQAGSLTVEVKIAGLQAKSSHISHVHVGSCQSRGTIMFALNQVVADGQGVADTKTTISNAKYPPASGTWYVVVHAGPDMQGSNSQYLLCGNLFK